MGYADDFYIKENIIGYSGKLHYSPTVYFENKTGLGIRYGHITQEHPDKSNVGREEVLISNNYQRGNIKTSKGLRFYERDFQNGFEHLSRTARRERRKLTMSELIILARSIDRFTKKKKNQS